MWPEAIVLGVVENILRFDDEPGHEIVDFLCAGRLDPLPAVEDASLIEIDGTIAPVVWRTFRDDEELLPIDPAEAMPSLREFDGRRVPG